MASSPENQPIAGPTGGSPARPISRRTFLITAAGAAAALGLGGAGAWIWQPWRSGSPAASASPTGAPATPARTAAAIPVLESFPGRQNPVFTVPVLQPGRADGYLFLSPVSIGGAICNDRGDALWIKPPDATGRLVANLRVGTYQGRRVVSWWEGINTYGHFRGEFVLADESYAEVARIKGGNGLEADIHEFVLTTRGTALILAYIDPPSPKPGPDGVVPLVDCAVQEIDVATGRVLFEWRSSKHVTADESYLPVTPGLAHDYFHANSIEVDTDENLIISARNTCAVYKLDRTTGNVIWRLGGKRSDFEMGAGTTFIWQHDARRQPDGTLTIFDDGSSGSAPPKEDQGRGIVLALDESAHAARLVRVYTHTPGILSSSQGSMQVLPNGNVLVGWGSESALTEFDAAGKVVLDGKLPPMGFSYRTLRYEWRGRPTQPPVVETEVYSNSTTVHVRWNGATEVATWTVLGGEAASTLAPLGSAVWGGFETSIIVPGRPAFVAVRALDRSGATLGESAAQAT
jgi:hypothetical protein